VECRDIHRDLHLNVDLGMLLSVYENSISHEIVD